MIDADQLRAARALLNWKTADLARLSDVTVNAINNIERKVAQGRKDTLEKIQRVFEHAGVEFLPDSGVKFKPNGLEIYEGPERFDEFYEFLYDHMVDRGGEVCLMVADERLLAKYRTNPELQRQRMRELVRNGKVSYRVLVTIGDFTGDYVEYRQQPAQAALPTAFYAFGECLALISFPEKHPPHVVVIRSEPLTDSYRQAFHAAWEIA